MDGLQLVLVDNEIMRCSIQSFIMCTHPMKIGEQKERHRYRLTITGRRGPRLAWGHELAGERANDRNPFRSGRRVRQDFGMSRLESSGSDCRLLNGYEF